MAEGGSRWIAIVVAICLPIDRDLPLGNLLGKRVRIRDFEGHSKRVLSAGFLRLEIPAFLRIRS